MKRPASKARLWAIAAAVLLPLATVTVLNRISTDASKRLATIEHKIADVKAKQAEVQDQLDALRQASQAPGASFRDASAPSPASSPRAQATDTPAHSWRTPPPILPSWEPDSPYVWMEKGALHQLPLTPLEGGGRIQPGFAEILGMSAAQKAAVESALQKALQQHFTNEMLHARVETQPPTPPTRTDASGVATQDIAPASLESIEVVIPALGAGVSALVRGFEDVVQTELGLQRKQLFLASAQSWLDEEFSYRGENEKRYSARRLPDGAFEVSSVRGPISLSHGGVRNLHQAFPAHLVPLFAPLEELPPRGVAPARDDAPVDSSPNP